MVSTFYHQLFPRIFRKGYLLFRQPVLMSDINIFVNELAYIPKLLRYFFLRVYFFREFTRCSNIQNLLLSCESTCLKYSTVAGGAAGSNCEKRNWSLFTRCTSFVHVFEILLHVFLFLPQKMLFLPKVQFYLIDNKIKKILFMAIL